MKNPTITTLIAAATLLYPWKAIAGPMRGEFFYNLFSEPYFWLFILVGVLLILAYNAINKAFRIIEMIMKPQPEKQEEDVESTETTSASWWSRTYAWLTALKPMEKEKDLLLDHDYDGIKELDNSLPPWWLYGFYVTIIFSIGYLLYFHVLGIGKLSEEEYLADKKAAEIEIKAYLEKQGGLVDETNVTIIEDTDRLKNGKKIFQDNCASCHAMDGGGGIGPNLTDEYWLHGGSINDIFRVIKYGVPEKGMIPWKDLLSPPKIQDVSSYIISLQGTTPANPIEPQGEKHTN